jgi:hypothetical protein
MALEQVFEVDCGKPGGGVVRMTERRFGLVPCSTNHTTILNVIIATLVECATG